MRNLFKPPVQVGMTAPGERVYAVGDVHGRYDLLRALLALIVRDWEENKRAGLTVNLIFLGDVIDRGPDSRSCLAMLKRLTAQPHVHLLRGNHEDLLLKSIAGEQWAQEAWLAHGGLATLANYGIEPPAPDEDNFDFAERLARAIPADDLALLRNTPLFVRNGNYLFVHAGVRPRVAFRHQEEVDLIFIRDEFTQSDDWHGAVVVHGHSIVDEVNIRPNRIAIDTGAWRSGRLSCVALDGKTQRVIST